MAIDDAEQAVLRALPVDLDELAALLEGGDDVRHGLVDLQTGDVYPYSEMLGEYLGLDEDVDPDESADWERWLVVHRVGSRAAYHDMVASSTRGAAVASRACARQARVSSTLTGPSGPSGSTQRNCTRGWSATRAQNTNPAGPPARTKPLPDPQGSREMRSAQTGSSRAARSCWRPPQRPDVGHLRTVRRRQRHLQLMVTAAKEDVVRFERAARRAERAPADHPLVLVEEVVQDGRKDVVARPPLLCRVHLRGIGSRSVGLDRGAAGRPGSSPTGRQRSPLG